jgi:hypothetical protein
MRLKVSSLPSRRTRLMRGIISPGYNTRRQVDAALRIRTNPKIRNGCKTKIASVQSGPWLGDRLCLDCEQGSLERNGGSFRPLVTKCPEQTEIRREDSQPCRISPMR